MFFVNACTITSAYKMLTGKYETKAVKLIGSTFPISVRTFKKFGCLQKESSPIFISCNTICTKTSKYFVSSNHLSNCYE